MGRPPKAFMVLKKEQKSHRTKGELDRREKGEKSLTSGIKWHSSEAVRARPAAKKAFDRLTRLFAAIGKNDALCENVMNRYCLMLVECDEMERRRDDFESTIRQMDAALRDEAIELADYLKLRGEAQSNLIALDKQIQRKRRAARARHRDRNAPLPGFIHTAMPFFCPLSGP